MQNILEDIRYLNQNIEHNIEYEFLKKLQKRQKNFQATHFAVDPSISLASLKFTS